MLEFLWAVVAVLSLLSKDLGEREGGRNRLTFKLLKSSESPLLPAVLVLGTGCFCCVKPLYLHVVNEDCVHTFVHVLNLYRF